MRKLLSLTLILSLTSVATLAQRRQGSRTPSRTNAKINKRSSPPVRDTAPTFLKRQGAASIGEMMNEPPTFSYGSSINVWLVTDHKNAIREIAVTGHGDSPTCRRVSGKIMSMFLDKRRELDDLFVAGAAHMTDRGNEARRKKLAEVDSVKVFMQAEDELQAALFNVQHYKQTAGTGTKGMSALEEANADLKKIQERIRLLGTDPIVQEYLGEDQSAQAMSLFANQIRKFSRDNGLVFVRQIPLRLIDAARSRIAAAVRSDAATVVAFDSLLSAAKVSEAALITPVLTIPDGRPLELRVPLARMTVSTFEEAQRNNRNEVEKAIIGDVRQRLSIYDKSKKETLAELANCKRFSPQSMNQIVVLSQITTEQGIIYQTNEPERLTRKQYCEGTLPLNLQTFNTWTKNAEGLLDTVNKDATLGADSRLRDFTNTTLFDSMLRDWRLPVARSQAAFDTWRKEIRGPVWDALNAQLKRSGIAPDVVGGEQMIFAVQEDGADLIIRPQHVIDMARSVVLVDPAAKATRVLDAWSLRTVDQRAGPSASYSASSVPLLIRGLAEEVNSGDPEDARSRLMTAFSLDPEAAFKELEREWLSLFPDTHQRLSEMRQSLQSQVEAMEWTDAYERFKGTPAYKESDWDYLRGFQDFLDSYPKAPVDLHLNFAFLLARRIADSQNNVDRAKAPMTALNTTTDTWSVIEAFSQPLPSASPRPRNLLNRKSHLAALKSWRQAQDKYLGGRVEVTLNLAADPAPMILKTIQEVKQRDPKYWNVASSTRKLPTERSDGWKLAEKAMQKELTLFESHAQSLIRLNDWLRKSYWGSQSAQYLWSTPNPDMPALLSIINAAVGDGSTGSDSAYRGPKETVSVFVTERRKMDTLTRYQNADQLHNGSEGLLEIARTHLEEKPPRGFRESLPLSARFWFESGHYMKAFFSLFADTAPVALYSPEIDWQALPGDAVGKPLSVTVRMEDGVIIFAAEFERKKKADVLAIAGLSEADSESLYDSIANNATPNWSEYGKLSDQILLMPLPIRPAALRFRRFLLAHDTQLRIMKSMIYGRHAPGDEFLSELQTNTALEQRRTTTDEVRGDRGRLPQIPTLAEVKKIAISKIRRED